MLSSLRLWLPSEEGRPEVKDVTLDDAGAIYPPLHPPHSAICFLNWSLETNLGTWVHTEHQACLGDSEEEPPWRLLRGGGCKRAGAKCSVHSSPGTRFIRGERLCFRKEVVAVSVCLGCCIRVPQIGSNNRNVVSHHSGAKKSKVEVSGLILSAPCIFPTFWWSSGDLWPSLVYALAQSLPSSCRILPMCLCSNSPHL